MHIHLEYVFLFVSKGQEGAKRSTFKKSCLKGKLHFFSCDCLAVFLQIYLCRPAYMSVVSESSIFLSNVALISLSTVSCVLSRKRPQQVDNLSGGRGGWGGIVSQFSISRSLYILSKFLFMIVFAEQQIQKCNTRLHFFFRE